MAEFRPSRLDSKRIEFGTVERAEYEITIMEACDRLNALEQNYRALVEWRRDFTVRSIPDGMVRHAGTRRGWHIPDDVHCLECAWLAAHGGIPGEEG